MKTKTLKQISSQNVRILTAIATSLMDEAAAARFYHVRSIGHRYEVNAFAYAVAYGLADTYADIPVPMDVYTKNRQNKTL